MRLTAPAKLNLFLHIIGKRDDGYHLLESLIAFTEFGDVLTFEKSDSLSLSISGPFKEGLDTENNLIMEAARLLQSRTGCKDGVRITLEKNIPVGAGLGGGSSDAGLTLKALVELWKLLITDGELQKLALTLGADVPVCLVRKPCFVNGIGEHMTPITMKPACYIVLVNPGRPLLTADIFRKFSSAFSPSKTIAGRIGNFEDLIAMIAPMHNDLEASAKVLMPEIGEILQSLSDQPGCRVSRMSGSGATCFGLFEKESDAISARNLLARAHSNWWSMATRI